MWSINKICLCGLLTFLGFLSPVLSAQTENDWHQKPVLTLSGFADIFYVYDFNHPQGNSIQPFLFNHNRHNEFNLNLGLVKFQLESTKYRANLALQTGTYANDNYVLEPGLLKGIFEANIGLSLNRKNSLWLDAGILPSPIGFESAISMDNLTLTRSLAAENSPYFLTGAQLSYSPSEKWYMAVLVVNGWQRIQRLEGNSMLSTGTQLQYSPMESIILNWSTFIGTDDPDDTRRMRYFNNLFGQFQLMEKLVLIAGIDIGVQQETKGSSEYDLWWGPVMIAQYAMNSIWKMAIRAEYYQDETGIVIPTESINGFRTTGLSLNLDYSPSPSILCRLEGRWLHGKDAIFETKTTPTDNDFFIGTSVAIKFSEVLSKDRP